MLGRPTHATRLLGCIALVATVTVASHAAAAKRSDPSPAITIKVGSMTVNGMRVKNLKCTLVNGGFLAAAKVVGALAKKRKALRACARGKKVRPRVSWRFKARSVTHVKVRNVARPKVRGCVARVMLGVRVGLSGSCTATLLLP
ncbi:MAG: hypothetical protein KC503_36140 [Myxococcales bacterium]|nr:hypothetical protein [Myxococcales bacterium]